MIYSLEVQNYRNIKHLDIRSLGRVNLITGKNNSGKSTLLEAISVFVSGGDLQWIGNLLSERGENYFGIRRESTIDSYVKSLSSLFHGRSSTIDKSNTISISTLENTLFGLQRSTEQTITMRFVRYVNSIDQNELSNEGQLIRNKKLILSEDNEYALENNNNIFSEIGLGFEIKSAGESRMFPLDDGRFIDRVRFNVRNNIYANKYQFIRTNSDREANSKLWDNIALTEKEEYVIEALRIIEPSLDRIAFVGSEDSSRVRTTVVKLKGSNKVFPIRSMGDGINRILTIVLALVNADNGYLFIDEIENGLHYAVQKQLWEVIFEVAKRLNIQVFASTHSEDCIKAFGNVSTGDGFFADKKLFRLDNVNSFIRAIEFNSKDLSVIAEQSLDPR